MPGKQPPHPNPEATYMARPRGIEDILARLPDAKRSGAGWEAPCPLPGHSTPQGHLSLKDAGDKALVTCQGARGHDYHALCQALGFDSLSYGDNGATATTRPRVKQTRFEVRTPDGQLIAVHLRRDGPTGKSFTWLRPSGESGLGGVPVADLPLYGSERLKGLPQGAEVVVTEGEKAAQALLDQGRPAVGTVTGADGAPGLDALRPLIPYQVFLWPDNDSPGRGHMVRIAARLRELGVRPRMLAWPQAPPGGDAADAVALGMDIPALLAQAQPYEAAPTEDLDALLKAVEQFIRRYVVVGEAEGVALALWVAHTHAFQAAECTPYLHITSAEKQSGKTRLLEAMALVVARPWFSSRVSAAVLVRKVSRDTPSLLLDESDSAFKAEADYAEALRGILNAGYRRGGVASLCVKKGADFDLVDFSTFCPKALAGIGRLPDTVADRSILVKMKRRAAGEEVSRFRFRDAQAEGEPLRERLAKWANTAVLRLGEARPDLPGELSDRAADCWEPLLAIADLAGGDWPRRGRKAAQVLSGQVVDETLSLGAELLRDIASWLNGRDDPIPSGELVKGLVEMEESPWGDLRGRPLDTRKLASFLKPYGIKPRPVRVGAGTVRGYHRADFEDAFARYACIPGLSETSETSETKALPKSGDVTDVTHVTLPGGIHAAPRLSLPACKEMAEERGPEWGEV